MIKIILAEDHRIVRNGIKTILESESDMDVIGEADNGLDVLSLLQSGITPDIVLTDISMPEMDGIALAAELAESYPDIKVIVLSMMDNVKYLYEAFKLGIKGYLLKSTGRDEMLFSIRYVSDNNEVICAELGMRMLRMAIKNHINLQENGDVPILTARELEILVLIADGNTNGEIADKTFTSKRTVEGHRQSIISKLGVKNTAQLITYACKAGLI